jgi:hypothetical protein
MKMHCEKTVMMVVRDQKGMEFRSSTLVQSIPLRVWVVKAAKDLSQAEEDRKALGL